MCVFAASVLLTDLILWALLGGLMQHYLQWVIQLLGMPSQDCYL